MCRMIIADDPDNISIRIHGIKFLEQFDEVRALVRFTYYMFSLEMFENIAYIMAKHADPTIPDSPEEWLDEFSTFSIYQVLPKIIELWGLNVQTDVESKKKFTQQIGR